MGKDADVANTVVTHTHGILTEGRFLSKEESLEIIMLGFKT